MKFALLKPYTHRLDNKQRGFSLLEILLVVAVISTLASVGFLALTGTTTAVQATKLTSDVGVLNSALRTYVMSGGDLTAVKSGTEVIEKLKTTTTVNQRSRIAGLRGTMVDPRIQGIASTGNGKPRAVWDNVRRTFIIQTEGAGFSEFILAQGVPAAPREESRQTAMELDSRNKWIWGYGDGTPPTVPAGVSSTSTAMDPTPAALSDRVRIQLEAPVFSLSSGAYALKKFDLALELNNPNPPSVSEILYAVNGGPYQTYESPLSLPPDTTVTAFSKSLDSDNWLDSANDDRTFTANLIPLDLRFDLSASQVTYAQIGGRMLPGGPGVAVVPPGWATIANLSDIPSSHQNSSVFMIGWTYDGENPFTSSSTVHGASFSDGFPGQAVSIAPDIWGSNNSLKIRIVALSLNPLMVTTSNTLTKNLHAQSIDLRAPLITQNETTGIITMTPDTSGGDMPEGARIFYTTDGKDPDKNVTTPANATLYTGPFAGAGTIKAGIYPPVDAAVWFNASPVATYVTPLPQKLLRPEIALSGMIFTQTTPSITVTLTNPNPTGISQIFLCGQAALRDLPCRHRLASLHGSFRAHFHHLSGRLPHQGLCQIPDSDEPPGQ